MDYANLIKCLSLGAALCLIPLPVTADELRVTHAQVIKTNASLGPYATTKISDVSVEELAPDASEQLLRNSWVNDVLLEEYARALRDNDEPKLREVHQASPRDIPIPTGGGNTQVTFKLSDGTQVKLSNLWDWKLTGYLQSKFWDQFWEKASTVELPGTQDSLLIPPPQ